MDYRALPHSAGVYILTNTANGRYYVGSTANLYKRVREHLRGLRKGTHGNPYLQRAWIKNGENAFTASVLELVSDSTQLVQREQIWLDRLCDKVRSYNILPSAYSTSGYERPAPSQESLERASWSKSSPIEGFITPDGHELTILNVGLFCRENDLTPEGMYAIASGASTSYRGWTHHNAKIKQREWIKHFEGFIDPSGVEVPQFENLEAFCRERNLDPSTMRKLALGKKTSHHGWTHRNAPPKIPRTATRKAARYTGFVSPAGESVVIENLTAFCRENGLDHASMYKVIQGKARQHKGWTYRADTASIEEVSYKQRK